MTESNQDPERTDRSAASGAVDEVPLRVGGMALQNGLLLQTARHWAAAVREADGSIGVTSGVKRFGKTRNAEGGVPILRGLARLADSFSVIPALKGRKGSAILPFQAPRILGALGLSTLVTAASRRLGGSQATQETRALVLGLVPVLLALRDSELAAYHGAEHKAIDEYELTMRGEDAAGAVREHARCGSSLVVPLVATSLAGNIAMRSVIRRPSPATVALGSLLSLGSALEIYRWAGKRPDSPVARGLARSSYLLQHFFTTREPSEEQMAVAREALAELLRLEGRPSST